MFVTPFRFQLVSSGSQNDTLAEPDEEKGSVSLLNSTDTSKDDSGGVQ